MMKDLKFELAYQLNSGFSAMYSSRRATVPAIETITGSPVQNKGTKP